MRLATICFTIREADGVVVARTRFSHHLLHHPREADGVGQCPDAFLAHHLLHHPARRMGSVAARTRF